MQKIGTTGCDAPLSIRYNPPRNDGKGGLIYYFPGDCGKCLRCLTKRKAHWSFRLTEEKRAAFSSYFVTLTYNDKYVPHGDDTLTINKQDHKDFIHELKEKESQKALAKRKAISQEEHSRKERKIAENGKLKYYGIYEYGDQLGRPHAHYLLFNVRDIANIVSAWNSKGNIDIDHDVNVNNIDYVLKYMIKDHSNIDYEDKQKEVSFQSKGIGISAGDTNFTNYIRKTNSTQVLTTRSTKISIPRYYRKKFLTEDERNKKAAYIANQIKQDEKKKEDYFTASGVNRAKVELMGKMARQQHLESRSKRTLE